LGRKGKRLGSKKKVELMEEGVYVGLNVFGVLGLGELTFYEF
jgi:hypothetical protein